MSRRVFEYFFDSEELEPFLSELPKLRRATHQAVSHREIADEESALSDLGAQIHEQPIAPPDVPSDASTVEGRDNDTTSISPPSIESESASPPVNADSEQASCEENGDSKQDEAVVEPETASSDLARSRVRQFLSVHALGQKVFCDRSAILAAETGDDRDLDEPLLRLTFLPNFDLERIEEVLSSKMWHCLLNTLAGACFVVFMFIASYDEQTTRMYVSMAIAAGLFVWSISLLFEIGTLVVRRRNAMHAEAAEPLANVSGTQQVNWWSMLKAGFEPISYQRQFRHPELPLEGNPWRVLQRGDLRIPVIKCGGFEIGPEPGKLFPKHEVRLVAYALLLEFTSHLQCPYGLVFPADSPNGLAFAITDELRQRATNLLANLSKMVDNSQQRSIEPRLPQNQNRCANCDYGRPEMISMSQVNKERRSGNEVLVLQGNSETLYHCQCGDRFGSAPPHRLSMKKGLRAVLG